jgi:hypothetical protein
LSTDRRELITTLEFARAGSGAATSRAFVGVRPPNTSGKPLVSSVSRSPADSACASSGIRSLMPPRIRLLRTSLFSAGNGEDPSGTAISHATSSNATTDTTAPPASSMRCSGLFSIARRSRVPNQPASVCPSTANAKIATSDTTRRTAPSANWLAISGPICRPMRAPLKNPPMDSAPITNPCR